MSFLAEEICRNSKRNFVDRIRYQTDPTGTLRSIEALRELIKRKGVKLVSVRLEVSRSQVKNCVRNVSRLSQIVLP